MKYWRLTTKGDFQSWKEGRWVKRYDYDNLLRENQTLKRTLTWNNFTLKFAYLLDNDIELDTQTKFALQIYFNGLIFLAETSKEQLKPKQTKQSLKEEKC